MNAGLHRSDITTAIRTRQRVRCRHDEIIDQFLWSATVPFGQICARCGNKLPTRNEDR